jgi:hypothetical protein
MIKCLISITSREMLALIMLQRTGVAITRGSLDDSAYPSVHNSGITVTKIYLHYSTIIY